MRSIQSVPILLTTNPLTGIQSLSVLHDLSRARSHHLRTVLRACLDAIEKHRLGSNLAVLISNFTKLSQDAQRHVVPLYLIDITISVCSKSQLGGLITAFAQSFVHAIVAKSRHSMRSYTRTSNRSAPSQSHSFVSYLRTKLISAAGRKPTGIANDTARSYRRTEM